MRDKTFLIMAGGTGGHVFPALATAQELMERNDKVIWLGSDGGMEESIVKNAQIDFYGVKVKGVRGKGWMTKLTAPIKILTATLQAAQVIRKTKPDVVLGLGGFASGPGGVAAKLMGRPLLVHEQNSVAGMTNRILAKVAHVVMTAFPNAFDDSSVAAVLVTQVGLLKFAEHHSWQGGDGHTEGPDELEDVKVSSNYGGDGRKELWHLTVGPDRLVKVIDQRGQDAEDQRGRGQENCPGGNVSQGETRILHREVCLK